MTNVPMPDWNDFLPIHPPADWAPAKRSVQSVATDKHVIGFYRAIESKFDGDASGWMVWTRDTFNLYYAGLRNPDGTYHLERLPKVSEIPDISGLPTFADLANVTGSPGPAKEVAFATVADFKSQGLTDGQKVSLLEYAAGTGLGGGSFIWQEGSTADPDSGGIFAASDSSAGRFIRVAHLLGAYTPEDFGAVGDNSHDDLPAWLALAEAVTKRRGGSVTCRHAAHYYYGQYIDWSRSDGGLTDEWKDAPIFRLFDGLVINLNGATIQTYRGGQRTPHSKLFTDGTNVEVWDSTQSAPSGLVFSYGKNLQVFNGNLLGSADTWSQWRVAATGTRTGAYPDYPIDGKHLNETYSCGLQVWSCENYQISNITAKHWMTDGFVIIHSEVYGPNGAPERVTNATRLIPRNGTLTNCTAKNNRRQGLSVVAARRLMAINCDFSETGFAYFNATDQPVTIPVPATGMIDSIGRAVAGNGDGTVTVAPHSGILDGFGWHEPGCGIDVEPSTYPTYAPDPNWRVPEMTGDVVFFNCSVSHNINGPMAAIYSVKVDGGVLLQNSRLDSRGEQYPDAWVAAACGVTFENCTIILPKNGFLWQDHGADRIQDNLFSKVINSRVYVTSLLGYRNAAKPIDVELRDNKIYLPEALIPDDFPISFIDRDNVAKTYGIGKSAGVKFTGNHVMVPYSLGLSDLANGAVIAAFEGCGQVSGNIWELTGQRPSNLGQYWNLAVMYSTALGGTNGKLYDTKPASERFIVPNGAPITDFTQDTPSGFKSLPLYNYEEPQSSYIPFGLGGQVPAGDTTVLTAMIGEGAINAKSLLLHGDGNLQPGLTLSVTFKRNGTQFAKATFATGDFNPSTVTGLPAKLYQGDALSIVVSYGGTATTYDMTNLVGMLSYDILSK